MNDDSGKSEKNRPILTEAASILFLLSAIVSPPTTLPLRDLLSDVVDATGDYYYCSPSICALGWGLIAFPFHLILSRPLSLAHILYTREKSFGNRG